MVIHHLVGFAILELAGGRPVPHGLGSNSATGEFGDMAGLAGHRVSMIIELDAHEVGAVMGAVRVAAFA